jgi:hypothetical protein
VDVSFSDEDDESAHWGVCRVNRLSRQEGGAFVSSLVVFCISELCSVEFEDASETQLETVLFSEGGHRSVAGH